MCCMDFYSTFGREHLEFLSKRQDFERIDVKTATIQENQHRGIRSGIRRKSKAVIECIQRGEPTSRAEREQDRRAAKYLMMMFGCILQSDKKTIENVIRDKNYLGKMVRVCRAVWLSKAFHRFETSQPMTLDDVYESNLNAAIEFCRASGDSALTNYEVGSFNQAYMIVNMFLREMRDELNRSYFTEEDYHLMAFEGIEPDYLSGVRIVPVREVEQRTNHVYEQMDSSTLIFEELKARVRCSVSTRFGWKKRNQVVAMCLRELEKQTIEGLQRVESVLQRFEGGKMSTGKRRKSAPCKSSPLSKQEIHILHGAVRAKSGSLSRVIGNGVYAVRAFREPMPAHDRG